jgi:D-alanyl-D-alanine carboxypeptidase/D-alanyl-D-alanine-endopeptidase (penicillin-binding protein 4)
MKRILFVLMVLIAANNLLAQEVGARLKTAFAQFENDPQLKAGLSSLCVLDSKTGAVIFEKNSGIGLAPASTQKVITAAAAYELLGKEFRYETRLAYTGKIINGNLQGDLYLLGTGDPTLGSNRWKSTSASILFDAWYKALNKAGIKTIDGALSIDPAGYSLQAIPDGWIWQDIGNYYGAGAYVLNWKENQYDLKLASGDKTGSAVTTIDGDDYYSEIIAASKGSGDNAYIYLPIGAGKPVLAGTIPVNEKGFTISGAMPDPVDSLLKDFKSFLNSKGGNVNLPGKHYTEMLTSSATKNKYQIIASYSSPSLDSVAYWLNKKSINLYAEALVKSIALQKNNIGSTSKGVELIKSFWKSKGINEVELNIVDGSGLSPLNRVTTKAQASILRYAKNQSWFGGFYNSLPEYNGMKMKSGTIGGVKAFAGYHSSKSGDYIFSFIVNNYNGSSATLVQKMYKVLDVLK